MADIARRLALVAASFLVIVSSLLLASTGEGDSLPGPERAFTTPVEPIDKSADRLRPTAGSARLPASVPALLPDAAPAPISAAPEDDHASLLAWSRAFAGLAAALPEPRQAVRDLAKLEEAAPAHLR